MKTVGSIGHRDDPRQSAIKLAKHSVWTGLAFVAIVLVAVALELFSRTLVHFGIIEKNSVLNWSILVGEYALAAMDVLLLIGVVGKQAWASEGGLNQMATLIIVPIYDYCTPLLRSRSFTASSTAEALDSTMTSTSSPAIRLAIYSVVGTLIFIMLAAFAAALSYAGRRLGGEIGVASVGIGILSNALAVTNLLLYLIFLYRLIRKVLSEI